MTGRVKSSVSNVSQSQKSPVLNTRRIVMSGALGAIAILLGMTRLGFIPVPTAAGNATIMHLPAIIGGVLEGPIVGGIIGLIFGLYSFFDATNPFFKDPLVAILPRIFIGIVAYYVYAGGRNLRVPEWVRLPIAGFMGSVTNTVLVLGMIHLRFHWTWKTVWTVALVNGLPEAIVGAIITTAVVLAYKGIVKPGKKSIVSQ